MLSFSSLASVALASMALFSSPLMGVHVNAYPSEDASAAACANLSIAPGSQQSNATNVIRAFEDKNLINLALSSVNSNLYIQHNPDGADGIQMLNQALNIPGVKAKVVRSFTDQDYVVLHTEYDFFGPQTGFDIFRFENGMIVEHWDNLQPVAPPNPSGHNATDGVYTTAITDCDLAATDLNKRIVTEYVNMVYMRGQFNQISKYVSPNLIQHNTGTADGIAGMMALVSNLAANHLTLNYFKLHRVFGQGQFVLAVGEGTLGPTPGAHTAFYDLFRLDKGIIVEHWDVLSTIPAKENWKNENGKFSFPQQKRWDFQTPNPTPLPSIQAQMTPAVAMGKGAKFP